MRYEQIRYEIEDNLLTITLDRPEKLNAFTERMTFNPTDTDKE